MSEFISVATILLAAIAHATLQLGLGCLLLLYHESAGKHIKSKTRALIGSFISGIGIITFLLLAAACFVVSGIFGGALSNDLLIVVIIALATIAVIMWFFYYRRGNATELWLPKVAARFIDGRARVTNSNTEAFSLGVMTGFAEILFSMFLLIVAGNSILELDSMYQPLMVAFYTIIVVVPLVIFRFAIRSGHNVVDIQKWRVKNKLFLRIVSGLCFFLLGIFIFVFKFLG